MLNGEVIFQPAETGPLNEIRGKISACRQARQVAVNPPEHLLSVGEP